MLVTKFSIAERCDKATSPVERGKLNLIIEEINNAMIAYRSRCVVRQKG